MHHVNQKMEWNKWNKFFTNSKEPYFSGYFKLFPKNKIFSWLYHFFVLKKPKICMKFHKNSISCFLEKVVLINWLTGWQWCFHKQGFPYWGRWGESPTPRNSSPPVDSPNKFLFPPTKANPPALNNNFQVITQSKQYF